MSKPVYRVTVSSVDEDAVIQKCIIENYRNGYYREVNGALVEFCSILSWSLTWFDNQPFSNNAKLWRVDYDRKNNVYSARVIAAKV